uniref:Uncharacterized protein n=1 Tax=Rhizophora mucronata TaxID=61149 RepID=A0A2P2NQX7_RHIMU
MKNFSASKGKRKRKRTCKAHLGKRQSSIAKTEMENTQITTHADNSTMETNAAFKVMNTKK